MEASNIFSHLLDQHQQQQHQQQDDSEEEECPSDSTMTQSHYSLRWNNHQSHILAAFEALLQAETLVDVTLVCAETSVRAHKVVLSACSPFFQRIFSENPCKHPVIVLKDFSGWEVQAIVDFMYKGEISVVQEQLQSLIKAAESLQVRGLANQESGLKEQQQQQHSPVATPSPSPSIAGEYHHRLHSENQSPFSPMSYGEPALKLPHMSRLSFPETLLPRPECQSPIPRRKQARPRRRSGEMCGPQDLSSKSSPPPQPPPTEDMAENLSMKSLPPPNSSHNNNNNNHHSNSINNNNNNKEDDATTPTSHHHYQHHHPGGGGRLSTPKRSPRSPELDLSMANNNHHSAKDFRSSPPVVGLPPTLKQEIMENHSPLPFPPMPSVSALAMTPPHSKFFGLDSPLGLFPPGLDGCRNPLFDITDPRTNPDTPLFTKKKMGRPKGQHSAPRGGPPRSWTNAELTEALQHVWNKKMTTSQASRIFGIPYNSLLMYVRGKYGKSLKLEQLRKDCIAGPGGNDLLALSSGNNNNNSSSNNNNNNSPQMIKGDPDNRPPSADSQPPLFNPFAHSFYPDFGTGFPIPVSMIHLLPQSEKIRDHYATPPEDCSTRSLDHHGDEDQQDFRVGVVDDRRELVQQNGQD